MFRVARAQICLPGLAHRIVGRGVGIVEHGLDHIVRRLAAVQRVDHGLDHGGRAVIGAGVRPAFQIVGAVDVPFRNHPGFIQMGAEVRRRLDLAQGLFKMQVHRRGVDRVGIQDDQPFDLAGLHVVDQRDDILALDRRHGIYGLGVNHRLADIAQRLVDGDGGQMHRRRLLLAGNDHAFAGVGLQVRGYGGEELARGAGGRLRTGPTRSDGGRQGRGKRSDIAGLERQPVLGLEAGGAGRALDRVQPVHGEVLSVRCSLRRLA